jgi:hypothetical protein
MAEAGGDPQHGASAPSRHVLPRLAPADAAAAGCLRQGDLQVEAAVRRGGVVDGVPVTVPQLSLRVGARLVGRLEGLATAGPAGAVVQIAEMDPANAFPEVPLSSGSGGAHCCRQSQVLRADADGRQWRVVSLGPVNGGPAAAEDPLGDGRFRLVDADNRVVRAGGSSWRQRLSRRLCGKQGAGGGI